MQSDYTNCLIKPMGRNGDPTIEPTHVIDAFLLGLFVFFTVLIGDAVQPGTPTYMTAEQILSRVPFALVAFGMAFVFQWLRARGIDVLKLYRKFRGQE